MLKLCRLDNIIINNEGLVLKMSLINKGKRKGLSSRQKSIIEIITKCATLKPITISTISEKLKLSSRTILREMPVVEKWLDDNDFKFIKKPGVGLMLNESIENQKFILELLDDERVGKSYSKDERRKLILGELLSSHEPIKSFYFTSKYKISDGTLSNDLDFISSWLRIYSVELVRKSGVGVYISGTEANLRQAIANELYEVLEHKEIVNLLNGNGEDKTQSILASSNRLLDFIDKNTINTIETILDKIEEKLKIKYTDSAYIGLVVHLSLAIRRIENNEKIQMDKKNLKELMTMPEFSIADEIRENLEKEFHIEIPQDEVGFITMHLKGSKIWREDSNSKEINKSINMRQVANSMISIVENELDISFENDESLIEGVINHISPAISRISMDIRLKSPQMEGLMENYSFVYNACKKACDVLKDITHKDEIPEAEIAFISMHFAAAIEKNKKSREKISVVAVCPTGIGVSKLLAVNLKRHFDDIDVKGTISALNIDTKKLQDEGIDLIVSTVSLDVDYIYACVNPILMEQDRIVLRNVIEEIKKSRTVNAKKIKNQHAANKTDIIYFTSLGSEILKVLDSIKLFKAHNVESIDELIDLTSKFFAEKLEFTQGIKTALRNREDIASTYIEDFKMMLFHCKSEYVSHCRFGAVLLNRPFWEKDKEILGGIVMLMPISNETINREIMSYISGSIIEDETLSKIIIEGRESDLKEECEKVLSRLYLKKFKKRIGDVEV